MTSRRERESFERLLAGRAAAKLAPRNYKTLSEMALEQMTDFSHLNPHADEHIAHIHELHRRAETDDHSDLLRIAPAHDYACGICRSVRELVVDHCHDSKFIRGILCQTCNIAEGYSRAVFPRSPALPVWREFAPGLLWKVRHTKTKVKDIREAVHAAGYGDRLLAGWSPYVGFGRLR